MKACVFAALIAAQSSVYFSSLYATSRQLTIVQVHLPGYILALFHILTMTLLSKEYPGSFNDWLLHDPILGRPHQAAYLSSPTSCTMPEIPPPKPRETKAISTAEQLEHSKRTERYCSLVRLHHLAKQAHSVTDSMYLTAVQQRFKSLSRNCNGGFLCQ